jgi:menaquinone-dependent protoporphyrinogen oxidase
MFAGIVDLRQVPLWGRLFLRAAGGRSGDQRDWPAIEAWATEIAKRMDVLRAPAESDRT